MKCPKCETDNPDDSRFCKECAASLSLKAAQPSFTQTLNTPAFAVSPGAVLAERYEIKEKIGEGGMGEVYLAVDRSLDRQVAVKVLPAAFAEDAERLARFEREAKLLAVLNHPNIAAIYGLEESEGQRFLVLELVEGETLKAKLDKGLIGVEEALDLCHQIAEGLEAAHEKAVLHRDLKPGNIMITPQGRVKILDFGLAKAFDSETDAVDIEKSPTITAQITKPGVVLGTAAYMSPEQARGRAVDKRTDIWAFGCALFECLTGKRAFQGETVSDTMALILKGEPDWSVLPAHTPTNIRTLLRRCLHKNQKNRLHDIADARIEIDEAGSIPVADASVKKLLPWGWTLAAGAGLLMAGILIRPLIWRMSESLPQNGPVASVIKLEPGYSLDGKRLILEYYRPSLRTMAISHDGHFIVYCAANDGVPEDAKSQLFLRPIEKLESSPIAGTEGGIAPFLSPDDRWIGFWAEGKLKKIPVEGGVAQDLCDASGYGASWGVNDQIVFADNTNDGLSIVAASGGKPESLTQPDKTRQENDHRLPSYLPNAQGILFTVMQTEMEQNPYVALYIHKTREWKYWLEDASHAQYIPTGHIVFLRRGVLMAIPFSISDLETSGQAVPIRSDIMQNLNAVSINTTAGQYSISTSGSLIYASGGLVPNWKNSLAWVDHSGYDVPASSWADQHFTPRLSPDGEKIAFQTLYTRQQIWICDTLRDISSPFVSEGRSFSPVWSPDGKKIIFGRRESNHSASLFLKATEGSSPAEELIISIPPGRSYVPSSISKDGTRMAFVDASEDNSDILIFDFPSKSIIPFRATQYIEQYPDFSPDGQWLVYTSDRENRSEVYVAPSSGLSREVKVSREGGTEPGWARSGRQLFYRSLDGSLMWVVDVQTGKEFSAATPRLLFQNTSFGAGGPRKCWDISLDDLHFLMVKREERPFIPITEMILIQNWFDELKRLAPTGK